jgi:hypothetical protein
MSTTKSAIQATINLQNGLFCHIADGFLVISGAHKLIDINYSYDLSKTKDFKKVRIAANVIFTLIFIAAAVWTQFYPLIALMFLSIWDLRQLKRYKLPINKAKIIPISNISEIQLKKGKIGFNYMDIYIDNQGVKSFIPLQLYDSESTLSHAIVVTKEIGKLSESPATDKFKMEGDQIALNETSSYVIKGKSLFYTQNLIHDKSRIDSYQNLRIIAYLLMVVMIVSIGIKINSIVTAPSNYIDFVVVIIFVLLMKIPYKYSRKALPNEIQLADIASIHKGKRKTYISLKKKYGLNLLLHIKSRYLHEGFEQHLKTHKS